MPVSVEARGKVITALAQEPWLTTNQVARLFYSVKRDGTPAPAVVIKVRNREYPQAPGYYSARDLLDRMEEDGEIEKVDPPDGFDKTVIRWKLTPSRRYQLGLREKKEPSKYSIQHEMDAADLFVTYTKTGRLYHWDAGWSQKEYEVVKRFRINYDRRMELTDVDQIFVWEVDKGSEVRETLERKVDRYIELSDYLMGQPLTFIFTLQSRAGYSNADNRLDHMLSVFEREKRGNQFLVAKHQDVLTDPLGTIFHSPYRHRVSLLSLGKHPKH